MKACHTIPKMKPGNKFVVIVPPARHGPPSDRGALGFENVRRRH